MGNPDSLNGDFCRRKSTFIFAKTACSFWYSVGASHCIVMGRMMGIMMVSLLSDDPDLCAVGRAVQPPKPDVDFRK
ncbi:hypothetical protein [Yoonia sp. 2307UL14-13]|uniref:hypothetical protein n=1 Tax=Yoonia sp. 2307UL14-13 TaxID=3126506 RepID=UPI0030A60515